ncbi:MAG: Ribose-phosphate pyrophosphokinase [Alphaproteobacteria bacterium ADurb.Bin438]|nr:MAG: Ribose-phosphate pyrophosphokinase [Alphaproteobacteria bacterium ADurb.Bin438]
MKIISGSSNLEFASKVAGILGTTLAKTVISRFADSEFFVEIDEKVRGENVYVIQSTCNPANDNLMELLIILDALKRASPARVVAVIPYYGYARQDRKTAPRTPISAKLVANLITTAGADRVATLELHTGQIQGFFDIPVDNMYSSNIFANDIKSRIKSDNLMVVSPDVGGILRARGVAKKIGAELAVVDKRRERAGVSEVMNIIGDVKGKDCILVDDIADSAGTLCNAASEIMKRGAKSVYGYVTHGVFSGEAVKRIEASAFEKIIVTDTIPLKESAKSCKKIDVITASDLFAEVIKRINNEESVSYLF